MHVGELRDIREASFIMGVDRGAYWLTKHKTKVDLAIGDFDSVTKAERKFIEKHAGQVVAYPAQKDATDLELAVDEAVKLHPKSVVIYGAIGTRFDHTYAAVGLLLRLESHNILGQIVDNYNKVHIVRRLYILRPPHEYAYVSVLPLKDSAVITMKGFAYDVSRLSLGFGSTRGVSNEIRDDNATIIVHKGSVLVIESRDWRAR